jgi:23S rRNA (adenine2503-C2)-methyltransferase
MNFSLVSSYLQKHNHPGYRYTQLVSSIKKGTSTWNEVTGWPNDLQNALQKEVPFVTYQKSELWESSDGTKKAKLSLRDGLAIETVLMQPKAGEYSVCVSCEVGCPMACAFCSTGKMGFKRLLTAEEITDQWLFWQTYKPTHLVFMGMGEPFHNQAQVFEAIRQLTDPHTYNLGDRKISISTCGVLPGITALSQTYPQVNLAISLHAATTKVRSHLMPITNAYPLPKLQTTLLEYLKHTSRQLMFEYILLKGVNDQEADQKALISWLKPFPSHLIHINLIRYNPTNSKYKVPEKNEVLRWKRQLEAAHLSVSIRKNLGTDIFGACGQLATSVQTPSKMSLGTSSFSN